MRIHNMSTKFLVITIILISSFLSNIFLNPSSGHADVVKSDRVQVLQADIQSVVLDINVPAHDVRMVEINNQAHQRISIEGYGLSSIPGKPELPQRGFLVGVPPDAEVSLRVLATDGTIASGFQVAPAPQIELEMKPIEPGWDILESAPSLQVQFIKDQLIYESDAFYPSVIAELVGSGYLRDQRWVQVLVHPVQYNPGRRELKYYQQIKMQISFNYPQGISTALPEAVAESPVFETILKSVLVNYDVAKAWRKKLSSQSTISTPQLATLDSQPACKIAVDTDGIYRVTYSDLESVGIDVDNMDPRTIKLYNLGTEIPIYVYGQDDGVFDSDDYLDFYGQAPTSRYAVANIYWMAVGGADGLRMLGENGSLTGTGTIPASFQTTVWLEKDLFYDAVVPQGATEEHWWWNYVYPPSIPSQTYTTTLEHIATDPYSATLRANMHGYISSGIYPDHHTRIYLNDVLVEDAWWDGRVQRISPVDFPSSYLVEGVNSIRVECPNDTGVGYDLVLVNWFEIDYHDTYTAENDSLHFSGDEAGTWEYHVEGFTTSDIEIFDITDPAIVSRIINATVEPGSSYTLKFEDTITDRKEYLALTTAQCLSPLSIVQDTPSDLHSTNNGADYIIITHSDFYSDMLPLDSRRASQGLRTMVVDVQDIYDEFNYGICDPQAIRDFLAYAYANWITPSPSYVLLVGDGTVDTEDNLGTGARNYIPPYMADVDDLVFSETAADNRYVTISGDDLLPDMYIGRLPVNSSAEAIIMVNRILDYEQNPFPGDWNQKALFVADNADAAGYFDVLSDDIANNYFPAPYTAEKVYLGVNYPYENPSVQAKDAVIDNINEGVLLVNYIGHGSVDLWASEKLLRTSHIDSLTNGSKLPVVLSMTCKDGIFHWPDPSCLAESLVRAEGKGAITSWSPTGAGLATGHHYLDQGFFTAVFTDNIAEIGPATYLGKLKLYTETGGEVSPFRDLIDTYTLFGDPFMKLNLPACDAADYDNDGRITVGDVMQVAAHWDTEWGDANFDRKYDLDDDGDVDIVDVMWVAGRWEEVC